jgi:mannobiose 2-epimerase
MGVSPSALRAQALPATRPSVQQYRLLAQEVDNQLRNNLLPAWFPRTLDPQHGGFRTNYRNDWTPFGENEKGLVYQSRMTWFAATIVLECPDLAEQYRTYARHGADFLRQNLWDHQHGGFYFLVDEKGRPISPYGDQKHTYGNAFAIYGLAKAARVTGDAEILKMAIEAFKWLDGNAHDARSGGYFEALNREGRPLLAPGPTTAPIDQAESGGCLGDSLRP